MNYTRKKRNSNSRNIDLTPGMIQRVSPKNKKVESTNRHFHKGRKATPMPKDLLKTQRTSSRFNATPGMNSVPESTPKTRKPTPIPKESDATNGMNRSLNQVSKKKLLPPRSMKELHG